MYRTIVPTLFDALMAGKQRPVRASGEQFLTINTEDTAHVSFTPTDVEMHEFTVSMRIRVHREFLQETHTILAVDYLQSEGLDNELQLRNGRVWYRTARGGTSGALMLVPGEWHTVSWVHYWARQFSRICFSEPQHFPEAKLECVTWGYSPREQITPTIFKLGTNDAANATMPIDVQDLLIYRSALNYEELMDLHLGKLIQSSLEVYAPLNASNPTENRAQSLSEVLTQHSR